MFEWGIEKYGGVIHIDSDAFPTETILTTDIETDEKDNIVCVGVTGNGGDVYVYFYPNLQFFEWLRTKQLIGHDLKSAEIPWLKKYGFSMDNTYFDTKVGFYVKDSTRKSYGLKDLIKDTFNIEYPTYKEIVGSGKKKVTLDKQDKELVAAYNSCDVFWTHRLYQWLQKHYNINQKKFLATIEWPMTKLIYLMEQKGIKVDTKVIRRIHNENSKARRKTKKKLFEVAGEQFNPNSPKQVLPLLHRAGAVSKTTGEDDIKRFSHIPFVESLLCFRKYQKLCSTYTIPLYTEAIKANDSRIHTRFGQNTQTGRLSSSDPINLQNQPPAIRECFIAEAGNLLCEADWSNLEWRLPAHFSGESKLLRVLSDPEGDLHTETARAIFGKNEISEEERKIAKTCNFLLTNSGTAKRLASELNCSYKEAQEIYAKFWKGYPLLEAWTKETKRKARQDGGVSTMYGRWVELPKIKAWCGRSNCPVFGSNGFWCKECFIREETEREAVSVRVQGSGADMIKLAMLRLYREHKLAPVVTVHDSMMYEVNETEVEKTSELVNHVMENVVQLKVPLFVDIGIGKSWGEC